MIDEHHDHETDEPASGTNAGPGQRDAEAANGTWPVLADVRPAAGGLALRPPLFHSAGS
jgi:hypothetical protein